MAAASRRLPATRRAACMLLLTAPLLVTAAGCFTKRERDPSEHYVQLLNEKKSKTDNLRKGIQFLGQMSLLTRDNYIEDIQLHLNSWVAKADRTGVNYATSTALQAFSPEQLTDVGASNPLALRFGYWDIDYLFECRTMHSMSSWIVDSPLRDSLIQKYVAAETATLPDADGMQLAEAQKLFDWTMRNIPLAGPGTSVEEVSDTPDASQPDSHLGTSYLPTEAVMFSAGDFVVRGRVFCALAAQRGINTFWIAYDAKEDSPGKLWAIGAAIGDSIYLFEPKLGMPILNPDEVRLATLDDVMSGERILRRLNLPGQFDYAVSLADLKDLKILLDIVPNADSARMKMLQAELIQDERIVVYQNADARLSEVVKLVPDATPAIWTAPMLAQTQAAATREMLQTMTQDALRYHAMHQIWMTKNEASQGRVNHLRGKFKNTPDGKQGALSLYMRTRVDNERIAQLAFDPDVQAELGVIRSPREQPEQYQARIRSAQVAYARAKLDTSFLIGQLHYDRGNFSACAGFMKRVIAEPGAVAWHPAARYTLSRVYQEQGNLDAAIELLSHRPSPQEAGNRIRLRYLRRTLE